MVFQFPDLETLRLAIASAQVPPEVTAAPAEVAFDPAGRPSIKAVAVSPSKAMQTALKKLGVRAGKDHYAETKLTVDCWPQVLPVAKAGLPPEITNTTPVLFDIPAGELAIVVVEMLRLGNDRQSYRTVTASDGRSDRVLLRVIGPPYYTLLRAIDRLTTASGEPIEAFVERAPRVWVRIGYDHPLSAKLKPAPGQVLLLRPERHWQAIADGPFQDIYDLLDLRLPTSPVAWQESSLKGKLPVPLRLAAGNAADMAEMWVVTKDAVNQLDALVRDADNRLLSRLSFAVARENGETTIVLRTRPSKLPPPVLALDDAIGFKPFWKLPNLFLPVGKRLMPTLRRDAVRKLLADDPAQIVWLMPHDGGKFVPEVLPDDAFRPLDDWVDYIIDHEHEALQTWIQATQFDFESFLCADDKADRPKPPPADRPQTEKRDPKEAPAPEPPRKGKGEKTPKSKPTEYQAVEEAVTNAAKIALRELEEQFKAMDVAVDDPERLALWPKLARLSAAAGDIGEAAICWTYDFWQVPEVLASSAWEWLQAEDPAANRLPTAAEFDAVLNGLGPSPTELRQFVARALYANRLTPVLPEFRSRLPKIRELLERHEPMLGVRAIWLIWVHLAQASGSQADVLGLARVRDRLLNRLLTEGLNKERDLPFFLRVSGEQDSDRMRVVRERILRVYGLIQKWHSTEDVQVNRSFVDLLFAFGMARLGEATAARDLVRAGKGRLLTPIGPSPTVDPANAFLADAFEWRIENALAGKAHAGPLPQEMLARLETIDTNRGNSLGNRYPVDRLRQLSWVLEPHDKTLAYAWVLKPATELEKTIASLFQSRDAAVLSDSIRSLAAKNPGAESQLMIYEAGVRLSPRVGEEFATTLLNRVPAVLGAPIKGPMEHQAAVAKKRNSLFAYALHLAAHYDRAEIVQALFQQFLTQLKSQSEGQRQQAVEEVVRECLRSLRKLGLRAEIELFLDQMTELVLQGKNMVQLRAQAGARWSEALSTILSIAEGYLFFGDFAKARPLLDEARQTIFANGSLPKGKRIEQLGLKNLIRAYVSALGQCPVDEALGRFEELFQNLEPLANTSSTSKYYSWLHFVIVEDVVRALVSDQMTLGEKARRWLDEDEYLVRRRIHGDMRKLLAHSGL